MSTKTMKRLISPFFTPATSFVGVSLLTMPFCFKQCGIVLALLLLILCNILSRLTCHFLIKSAIQINKRKFVLLASHAFGQKGEFLAKLLIVSFMLGTCIANFIVIGDLASQIISYITGETTLDIGERRIFVILTTGLITVFTQGLNQNIVDAFKICRFNVFIYNLIAIKIMIRSFLIIHLENWTGSVNYWRLEGIFQCLPIFFMASFCHIQMLEIYHMTSSTGSKLKLLNIIAKEVLNRCTYLYSIVGFLGYICCYNTQSLTGNILMNYKPIILLELINAGFLYMVVNNFPLVIFIYRNNLDSLIRSGITTDELFVSHLSKFRCCCLTILIVISSTIIAIRMPSLEFVLTFMGCTIGGMIFIFPAAIFICLINSSNLSQRLLSYFVVIFGVCFMAFFMYANFYPMKKSTNTKSADIVLNSISPSLNNISDDLHMNLNVSNNWTLHSGAKDNINNLEKNDSLINLNAEKKEESKLVFNGNIVEIGTAKWFEQLGQIRARTLELQKEMQRMGNTYKNEWEINPEQLKEFKVRTLELQKEIQRMGGKTYIKYKTEINHEQLTEIEALVLELQSEMQRMEKNKIFKKSEIFKKVTLDSETKNKINNLQKLNVLNETVSTLEDDIEVSIAELMIDEEKQSAEESDEATVNSFMPREELKVETFKTLNENLNAVDFGTIDKINNLQKPNVLNETVLTLEDDIEVSIAEPMIDEEKPSAKESDKAAVNSHLPREELKVETIKTLNGHFKVIVYSGMIDKINNLQKPNVLNETVSTLEDDIEVSIAEPMIDEEKPSAEESDKAAVNSHLPRKELKVETFKTLNENLNAVNSGTIDKINNLQKPNVLNETVSTLEDDIEVSIAEPMIDEEKPSAEESDKAAVNSHLPREELKVETFKTLNENLNAVNSGTIDKINNLQKPNVLNETVLTLEDDIEVSIAEPMIDEEKPSAEESDKAAVNSHLPREELKVETFKTLNENLNAVDSGSIDKINNLQKPNILNETVSTLEDDIEVSIEESMIDEKKQSAEESDEATVNSFMPREEVKVETIKTLNENLNAVDSGTIDKINNLQKPNVLNKTVSTLEDDIEVSIAEPMIDEEKQSAEESDEATVNSFMPREEVKVETFKTLYENLNAIYSGTIDIINNLHNGLNKAVSTLKDGIKVSILKPMIDQEEQSAEESDKAAVTSVMPKEEIKVEKKKTLNENIIVTQITADTKSSKIDKSVTLKAKDEVNIIKEKDQPVNLQKKSKGNLYSFKESSGENNMETSQEILGNNVHYFLRVGDKLIGLKKISEIFLPDRRKKSEIKYEFLEVKEQSVEKSIENCV
ncbi:putative sodium-coupled neutral amino acid transporter 10 [Nylanderia fulva]|uniref:putative sodium-coupled neutral amino acid transporter 10 n=1 Tax=Nylanderia fulva TaxID=613905 RepID=UPI0010FB5282|nr:putative sodium-coupled neutral amino acid transporter 10 [Nylanderia fulva]